MAFFLGLLDLILRRGSSAAYWGAMDDDLDMSMDLGIGNVSLARSPPAVAKKVSFDGGYQGVQQGVQGYAQGDTDTKSLRRGSSDYWTSGNWDMDQRDQRDQRRQYMKPDLNHPMVEELDTPSTQSGSASVKCLPRKDSNAYWDANQWDPDERIYVGAEAGQTNHLTAVIQSDDKLIRAWAGGLTCSGQPSGQLKFWRHWILLRRCRSFVIFTKLRQNLLVLGVSALWEKQLIGRRAPAVWWKVSRRLSLGQCTNPKWRMAYSTASCQCLGVRLTMASWSIWTCSKARIQGWAVGPGALWRIHAPYHQSRLLLYTLDLGLFIRSYYLILFDLESIWSSTTVVLTHRCQTLLRTTTTWSWRTLGAQSSWNRWSGFSLSLKLTVSKSCVKSWCHWPTFTTQWEFAIVISSSPHGFTRARE